MTPAHITPNMNLLLLYSIFVLEHKLRQIIEIQNYDKEPKSQSKTNFKSSSLYYN